MAKEPHNAEGKTAVSSQLTSSELQERSRLLIYCRVGEVTKPMQLNPPCPIDLDSNIVPLA